jgi:hypothetical protein
MHKDNNHRHRLKLGHLIQVLSTTLSLGSTALLVLTLTATGSRHHRRCRGHGRRNLRRPRNYLPRQLSRRGRNLYQLPLTRMRFPRQVEPDRAPTEPPAASVEPNELPPAGAAVEPNGGSAGPDNTAAEPDRPSGDLPAEAVEPNEAQPAAPAGEPNTIPSTPTVEPAKTPAELPSGAVEQTKAPDIPAGIVLQGANIPD